MLKLNTPAYSLVEAKSKNNSWKLLTAIGKGINDFILLLLLLLLFPPALLLFPPTLLS